MMYIVSIIPVLAYFLLIKGFDCFSLVKWEKLVLFLVWGVLACLSCMIVGLVVPFDLGAFSPFMEETVKCLPLIVSIYKKRSAFFAESLIYGSATGSGFAFLENIVYISFFQDFTFQDALIRGFGTSLLHIGCTALYGSLVIVLSRKFINSSLPVKVLSALVGIIPSFFIHYIYNQFFLPEFLQMLIVIVVMAVLFLVIFEIDGRLINRWLDMCISNDIQLYQSIKDGQFRNTRAGMYLISAKERLKPEVFFDVCMFMNQYLDITIKAKSRMILREAGMDISVDDEELELNKAKIKELAFLKESIGAIGMSIVSPLINTSATEDWAINELLS